MSDDAAPTKRGRKANAEKKEVEKAEPKKRARKVSFSYSFLCFDVDWSI